MGFIGDQMTMNKEAIITFKVDSSLTEAMRGVANRSEFIRNAVLAALENTCPLCKGRGVLTEHQKEHWRAFESDHSIQECRVCHETHLVCSEKRFHRSSGLKGVHKR